MKDFEKIVPLLAAIVVAIVLFLGVTTLVKKSLKSPQQRNTIDSALMLKKQERRAKDVQRRQRQLMRDQKQRMRDIQRR